MQSSSLILQIRISKNEDLAYIRQRTRQLAALGGLSAPSQTKFATVVSEITRNVLECTNQGKVRFSLLSENSDYKLQACIEDHDPENNNLQKILQNKNNFKNLVHNFDIDINNTGTRIYIEEKLPAKSSLYEKNIIDVWTKKLEGLANSSAVEELQEQNVQLIQALAEVQESKTLLSEQQKLLEQHTKELERANKLKANFVANMSHEMRTPLNAIIGISDILSKTSLNKHQQFLVNSLDAAGRSLLSLINDILDLSKLEAGKFNIEDIDFILTDTIKEALSVVQPQAFEKFVDLMLFWGPSLPQKAQGDPHRLQQIIINIVANAIKFSGQNSETDILIFTNKSTANNAEVRFVVFDTGIGISHNDQNKLFEAFTQINSSANRSHGGSGLGLSISRHLLSLMNGEIGFFSEKDVGTAFWFDIPFNNVQIRETSFRNDLDKIEIVFTEDKLPGFELLLKALGVKSRRSSSAKQLAKIKKYSTSNTIFIDDLPTEFAASKPSRLFNRLMEYINLPYRIDSFRSGKEKSLLPKKSFSKTLANCDSALLVEDHRMNQLIGQLQLEELGFDVDVCSSGSEAIQSVIRKRYSIIFMDCQLPEMDGYEITRAIRNLEKNTSNHTPVIAITASALAGEKKRCLEAGMDDYLSKPVDPEALYSICKKWLKEVSINKITDNTQHQDNKDEPPEKKVIDKQKLLEHFSKEQYTQLLEMFELDTIKLLKQLNDHIDGKNAPEAISLAHTLQGASRIIYAANLADSYRNMESALRAKNWDMCKNILEEIKKQFAQVSNELFKASLI